MIPHDAARFGDQIAHVLRSSLADELVGVYFVGSLALGGFVPGESDIDIVAVGKRSLSDDEKPAIASKLSGATADCPARGLEFTLYRLGIASSPPDGADFELNVNGGPRMDASVHLTALGEPPFWYVLDRAIAHRHGVVITGPPAVEVFADAPRTQLLEMMRASMRWHRRHERATLYSVLNASRAWKYAAEDVLGSKLAGAEWARHRWPRPALIDSAVDLRHGRPAELDEDEVDAFLAHVEHALDAAD
jgi:hypothetical protein